MNSESVDLTAPIMPHGATVVELRRESSIKHAWSLFFKVRVNANETHARFVTFKGRRILRYEFSDHAIGCFLSLPVSALHNVSSIQKLQEIVNAAVDWLDSNDSKEFSTLLDDKPEVRKNEQTH